MFVSRCLLEVKADHCSSTILLCGSEKRFLLDSHAGAANIEVSYVIEEGLLARMILTWGNECELTKKPSRITCFELVVHLGKLFRSDTAKQSIRHAPLLYQALLRLDSPLASEIGGLSH